MADRYVWSGAAGAGTGADWANAHTTLAAAITAGAAGDRYLVAHDHAESTAAAVTLTFKGTSASPDRALCVNRAGSVPPVAADLRTTAVAAVSGGNNFLIGGVAYIYGIIFECGSGSAATVFLGSGQTSGSLQVFDNCLFSILSTGVASRITPVNSANGRVRYLNCTVKFAAVAQAIRNAAGSFQWGNNGTSILAAGSSIPTSLVILYSHGVMRFEGLDLSSLGAGNTIFDAIPGANSISMVNCKLGASVTVAVAPADIYQGYVDVIGCDSGGTVARNERYHYTGTLTTETTIVRTGGASAGTTAYTWKVAATANNERDFAFETFEGALWNSTGGSPKTLTVHIVTDNVTLTDAEIWLEVEYLGSSAAPIASLIADAPATVLSAAANQAASTATWITTGLATPVKQKLEVTFTPQMAGPIRWRVKVAKPSTTVYICPKAVLS